MDHKRLLIIDDEPGIRDSLRLLLKSHFDVVTAQDGAEGLMKAKDALPDIVLLDLHMPGLDGLATLKALKSQGCACPVVMLTAAGSVESAVEAMKQGAHDFLSKPFDIEALTNLLLDLLATAPRAKSNVDSGSSQERTAENPITELVGTSGAMNVLGALITQIASKDSTVLITGESGTGKEVVARALHNRSKRSAQPFVVVNCAAIPEGLIESELFGHEKGAFTSAIDTKKGQCELADGGTLFLDEIGDLPLAMQVKLLRFLQEQQFTRVGGTKTISVDTRIICATNRNLEDMVQQKTFRQDLYYRVNVIGLEVPGLRERYEDIPLLIEHFVHRFGPRYDGRALTFTAPAMDACISYSWPGNVRELENVVESLMALAPQDEIDIDVIPRKILIPVASADTAHGNIFEGSLKFGDAEKRFESEMIVKALKRTNFVQTRAAELLGISRRILKYKMDKLGIPTTEAEMGTKVGS